ncbi:hypothetical protein [Bacteroides sp. 519]|nr:hypothetical protein [Bacteroides sp. 519]
MLIYSGRRNTRRYVERWDNRMDDSRELGGTGKQIGLLVAC